nr:MAG TPA: hypothetical protein [Caudoviricetes sp.]
MPNYTFRWNAILSADPKGHLGARLLLPLERQSERMAEVISDARNRLPAGAPFEQGAV